MDRITGPFVAAIARTWHRFEPEGQDTESLAGMLAPMDDAGEALSARVEFDMEPSDFLLGLDAMSGDSDVQ